MRLHEEMAPSWCDCETCRRTKQGIFRNMSDGQLRQWDAQQQYNKDHEKEHIAEQFERLLNGGFPYYDNITDPRYLSNFFVKTDCKHILDDYLKRNPGEDLREVCEALIPILKESRQIRGRRMQEDYKVPTQLEEANIADVGAAIGRGIVKGGKAIGNFFGPTTAKQQATQQAKTAKQQTATNLANMASGATGNAAMAIDPTKAQSVVTATVGAYKQLLQLINGYFTQAQAKAGDKTGKAADKTDKQANEGQKQTQEQQQEAFYRNFKQNVELFSEEALYEGKKQQQLQQIQKILTALLKEIGKKPVAQWSQSAMEQFIGISNEFAKPEVQKLIINLGTSKSKSSGDQSKALATEIVNKLKSVTPEVLQQSIQTAMTNSTTNSKLSVKSDPAAVTSALANALSQCKGNAKAGAIFPGIQTITQKYQGSNDFSKYTWGDINSMVQQLKSIGIGIDINTKGMDMAKTPSGTGGQAAPSQNPEDAKLLQRLATLPAATKAKITKQLNKALADNGV